MDAEPVVQVDLDPDRQVCNLTLNRSRKLNALSEAVRARLQDALDELAERDDVRVVTLNGAGRAFSAGADLTEPGVSTTGNVMAQRRSSGRWQRLLDDLERLPQVTVAVLHGHVVGGGALLAAACDFRIGSEDVSITIPELAIGIPLTWAGLPRLAREIGMPRTRDLVMTGRPLLAPEAHAWGFLHRVVPSSELERATDDLVSTLLRQPAAALAMTVDGLRALGRAVSAPETAWADPDLLRWSLGRLGQGDR